MQRSTLFLDRDSALHKLHPLTKLAFAGLFMIGAASLPDISILLGVFALLLLPLAAWGRLLIPLLRNSFLVIWPFVLSLALIQGFFNPGETALFSLGSFTFTQEGLLSGLTVAARLLLALGGTLLLMLSTRPDKLVLYIPVFVQRLK